MASTYFLDLTSSGTLSTRLRQAALPKLAPIPVPVPVPAWRAWAALGLILVVGIGFRAYRLGSECFDCDELYAVRIQGLSIKALGMMVARDAFHTNHPLLMSVPYLFWTAAFGTSETAVRLLPLLLSAAAIFLTYRLGVRLGGRKVGLIAAAIMALNPLQIAYAQEARNYAMLTLLVTAAHLSFVRCVQMGMRRDHVIYLVLCVLAAMTHYFAVMALAAHAAMCLWWLGRANLHLRRAAARVLFMLVLAAVPCLPWALVARHQAAQPWQHLQAPDVGNLTQCLLDAAALRTPWDGGLIGTLVVCGLIALALWGRRQKSLNVTPPRTMVPLPRSLGGVAVLLGWAGAIAAWVFVPFRVLPMARTTLEGLGYEAAVINDELRLLFRLLVLVPAAFATAGLLLLAGPHLLRVLSQPAAQPERSVRQIDCSLVCGSLLFIPILMTWIVGALGVPILQTRNLIILVPPLALILGFGFTALLAYERGRWLAGVAAVVLLVGVGQYQSTAAPLGQHGQALGMHTPDWKALDAYLREHRAALPLLTAATSAADPIFHYSTDLSPRRLTPADEGRELPHEFRLVHLERDIASLALVERLTAQGATLAVHYHGGGLTLLEVTLKAPSEGLAKVRRPKR